MNHLKPKTSITLKEIEKCKHGPHLTNLLNPVKQSRYLHIQLEQLEIPPKLEILPTAAFLDQQEIS